MTDIAIVGAGLIGRKHVDVVRRHARVAAIIDPNPDAQAVASAVDAAYFETVEEYMATGKPDGAIIATPNQLHLAHASCFIDAGIPVLVEKPLADNLDDARRLTMLATAADVPVLVGHHRRHSPVVQAVKAAIDSGRLGRLVTLHAQFWLYKPDDYFDVAWRRAEGAGPTYINLIHDIDLMRHFCGDIVSVQAMESHAVRGFDVEDTSAVILAFENGALGTVTISDVVAAPWSWELTSGENPVYPQTGMACYMIGGTKGSLSVPDLRLWHYPGKSSWWEPIESTHLDVAPADPVEQQFLHFLTVIEKNAPPLVSAMEGMKNIQLLDAIKRAAKTGLPQPLVAEHG